MNEPKATDVYRHWKKGTYYTVVGVSRSSEAWDDPDARCVVYFPMGSKELIHRPLKMWNEHIERDGYAGPRFVLVSGRK